MTKKGGKAKPVKTTIGLPITEREDDQILFRKLSRLQIKRGFRVRTDLLRVLINEEWERQYPGTQGGPK